MNQKYEQLLQKAETYRRGIVDGMPRSIARLYSQHVRLGQRQTTEEWWTLQEAFKRLRDAVKLLEVSFLELREKQSDDKRWQSSLRRAGEILEWLSHESMGVTFAPTHLLAAAAYQMAEYPARAYSLLKTQNPVLEADSQALRTFLEADFKGLLSVLVANWVEIPTDEVEYGQIDEESWSKDPVGFAQWVNELVIGSTLSAMGVLAAEIRWGDEERSQQALDKLNSISKLLLHSDDPYAWLLSKLCTMVGETYIKKSFRRCTEKLDLNPTGQRMLERYLRQSHNAGKTIAWSSQILGIERLHQEQSFVLCTPTGSGKTTVAEIAIVQGLFPVSEEPDLTSSAPLVMYLVPSRALATEVEFKLSQVFDELSRYETPIIITGLYGGTDWGPTDAWTTREDATVLICTYEKAEALVRFIGQAFLDRLSLVIVDEAHLVQFNRKFAELEDAENRQLRLEVLGTRLFQKVERNGGRVIALSAVAQGIQGALASWVSGTRGSQPAECAYQSTREMIGQLKCKPNGDFEIVYDLLDRKTLQLERSQFTRRERPYITNPFPRYPGAQLSLPGLSPSSKSKSSRPYLFWAAVQLAHQRRAVLISITQLRDLDSYAADFLNHLNIWRASDDLPPFFKSPDDERKRRLWRQCLASCDDYFGRRSREYRLLQEGIVVHHGKMPGSMARLLIQLIQEQVIQIVMATSTLTEGVNLPFEVILIPSLLRGGKLINVRELSNLVGRAGRPGYSTEGSSLVVVSNNKERNRYYGMIRELQASGRRQSADSSLAALLNRLYEYWRELTGAHEIEGFLNWLETISPLKDPNSLLNTFDGVLLTVIAELESVTSGTLSAGELEAQLKAMWQRSYAHIATKQEQKWERIFTHRGRFIVENQIYGGHEGRSKLYATSLPPRSGSRLIELSEKMRQHFETGVEYSSWNDDRRFEYIKTVVEEVSQIPKFATITDKLVRRKQEVPWYEVLHWWLDPGWVYDEEGCSLPGMSSKSPDDESAPDWYKYVYDRFIYRLNWGIGSFVSFVFRQRTGGREQSPSLDNWYLTDLPWVVFWLKELITWGTLEPVAAFLLARDKSVITRRQAEDRAKDYYRDQLSYMSADDLLDPSKIRKWTEQSSTTHYIR